MKSIVLQVRLASYVWSPGRFTPVKTWGLVIGIIKFKGFVGFKTTIFTRYPIAVNLVSYSFYLAFTLRTREDTHHTVWSLTQLHVPNVPGHHLVHDCLAIGLLCFDFGARDLVDA